MSSETFQQEDLSEGCLCAFTRDGLLMQRRRPGQRFRFDRINTGLATVPMAVTASSAFPGFFPPLELQGQDVGADPGQFGRLAFTDGGVYDNLGVRMFRCLERSWMAREVRLETDDLAEYGYRRLRVKKVAPTADEFVVRIRGSASKGQLRTLNSSLPATLRTGRDTPAGGGKFFPVVDVAFDIAKEPAGAVVDLSYEIISRESPSNILHAASFYVDVKTALLTTWLLLPEGKLLHCMDLLRFPIGKPSNPERVMLANEMVTPDGQIMGFTLLSVEPGYMYERRWKYRD